MILPICDYILLKTSSSPGAKESWKQEVILSGCKVEDISQLATLWGLIQSRLLKHNKAVFSELLQSRIDDPQEGSGARNFGNLYLICV